MDCINEVSQILEIGEQRIASLNNLRIRWQEMEKQLLRSSRSPYENAPDADLTKAFDDAIDLLTRHTKHLPRLLATLRNSLDVVSKKS